MRLHKSAGIKAALLIVLTLLLPQIITAQDTAESDSKEIRQQANNEMKNSRLSVGFGGNWEKGTAAILAYDHFLTNSIGLRLEGGAYGKNIEHESMNALYYCPIGVFYQRRAHGRISPWYLGCSAAVTHYNIREGIKLRNQTVDNGVNPCMYAGVTLFPNANVNVLFESYYVMDLWNGNIAEFSSLIFVGKVGFSW